VLAVHPRCSISVPAYCQLLFSYCPMKPLNGHSLILSVYWIRPEKTPSSCSVSRKSAFTIVAAFV
jgi:hypothetical protein